MGNFFRDILLYPLIVIQMILVGPHMWGANESSDILKYEAPRNQPNGSNAKAGKGPSAPGPIEDTIVNWDKKSKKIWNNLKAKARHHMFEKEGRTKNLTAKLQMGADGITRVVKDAYDQSQKTKAGQKAKEAVVAIGQAGKRVLQETWGVGGRTAKGYYYEQGKIFHETAERQMWKAPLKHGGANIQDTGPQGLPKPDGAADYVLKKGKFYSESSKSYMEMEMGSPTAQFISHHETRRVVEAYFSSSVQGWVENGGHKHINGTRQLREMLANMYRQANKSAVMTMLDISEDKYNKEYRHIVDGAIKSAEKEMSRYSNDLLKEILSIRKGRSTVADLIQSLAGTTIGKARDSIRTRRIRALNTGALSTGVLFRSIKLWPIETFYFNMAIAASSSVMANMFDDTFNPLYAKENRDMRHAGLTTEDLTFGILPVIEIPMLESLDLGFLGFIVGNQAFQKIAPYTKLPMSMRTYAGMGVGSITSALIHSVKDSPAWKAWSAASDKRSALLARAELLPLGAQRDELLTEALMWKSVAQNANSVVFNEVINSNFWKQQLDTIFTIMGATLAASAATTAFVKLSRGIPKGINIAGAKMGVNPGLNEDPIQAVKDRIKRTRDFQKAASKPTPLNALKGPKAAKTVRGVLSTVAFTTADASRGLVALLFAHPVMRLIHFSVFLLADPIIRAMSAPVMKSYRAQDAYNSLAYIHEELPNQRHKLNNRILFDRLTMDVYEGNQSYTDRIFNSGPYQESASIFWKFKDYYDSKVAYRFKQTERLSHKHQNWKTFLEKFLKTSSVTSTMYSSLERQIIGGRENIGFGLHDKGLIDPSLINVFNYSQYAALHKDTQSLINDTLNDATVFADEEPYAFDEANLAKWQSDLFSVDLDNLSSGAKDKSIGSGDKASEKAAFGELYKKSFDHSLRVFFRNEIAESILWGMVFGPNAKEETIFKKVAGDFPQFDYPRVIRELPYKNPSLKDVRFNLEDLVLTDEIMPSSPNEKIRRVYTIPLMRLAFYDPEDGLYKNILQMISDRALPELWLSSKTGENPTYNDEPTLVDIETYLKRYVMCMPEDKLTNTELSNVVQSDPGKCGKDSVYAAIQKYDAIFADFVEHDVSRIMTRVSGQGDSSFMSFIRAQYKYSPSSMLPNLVSLLATDETIDKKLMGPSSQSLQDLASADFKTFETGNENVFLSIMEDIIAAGGFLQTALPSTKDFSKVEQRHYYERAKQLQDQEREKGIAANTSKLVTNYLDMILATTDTGFYANSSSYTKTLDEMEIDFNKAMCYLHSRPMTIDPKVSTSSGVFEVSNKRYYRDYDVDSGRFDFTRIGNKSFCDIDQIANKIEVSSVVEAEVKDMLLDENAFQMDHWMQMFKGGQDGTELHPSEASPEGIAKYYGADLEQDQPFIVSKILETIFINPSDVISEKDRDDTRKMRDLLSRNLELATSISKEQSAEQQTLLDRLGQGQEQFDKDLQELAQAHGVTVNRINIDNNRKIQPAMSVRAAIASKAFSILRRITNEEAPQYHPYLMTMKEYAPTQYDVIAPILCDVRKSSGIAYGLLAKQDPLAPLGNVVCTKYDEMFTEGLYPNQKFYEREAQNQEKMDKYDEVYKPSNEWIRWWERLFN